MYRWDDAYAGKHSTSLFYIIRNKNRIVICEKIAILFFVCDEKRLKIRGIKTINK